jgi:hypothetical protein
MQPTAGWQLSTVRGSPSEQSPSVNVGLMQRPPGPARDEEGADVLRAGVVVLTVFVFEAVEYLCAFASRNPAADEAFFESIRTLVASDSGGRTP